MYIHLDESEELIVHLIRSVDCDIICLLWRHDTVVPCLVWDQSIPDTHRLSHTARCTRHLNPHWLVYHIIKTERLANIVTHDNLFAKVFPSDQISTLRTKALFVKRNRSMSSTQQHIWKRIWNLWRKFEAWLLWSVCKKKIAFARSRYDLIYYMFSPRWSTYIWYWAKYNTN